MTTTKTTSTSSNADLLLQKEREVRRKHPHVLRGTIRKEIDGTHAGKITVEISCASRGCKATRRVATSDLFQVRFCPDCTRQARNAARRAARSKASAAPANKKAASAKPAKTVKEGGLPPQKSAKFRIRKIVPDAGVLQSGPVTPEVAPAEMTVAYVEPTAN